MLMQLPKEWKNFNVSMHWCHVEAADSQGLSGEVPQISKQSLERAMAMQELTMRDAAQHLCASERRVIELLASKVAATVTMALPHLSAEEIEPALFARQMLESGEISFAQFIDKMENLFPHRMNALPEELKGQILNQMGVNH